MHWLGVLLGNLHMLWHINWNHHVFISQKCPNLNIYRVSYALIITSFRIVRAWQKGTQVQSLHCWYWERATVFPGDISLEKTCQLEYFSSGWYVVYLRQTYCSVIKHCASGVRDELSDLGGSDLIKQLCTFPPAVHQKYDWTHGSIGWFTERFCWIKACSWGFF